MSGKLFFTLFILTISLFAQKPKVWIYTDMTDSKLEGNNHMGTINDPDDISAMGGYMLMMNEFDTKGIVIASTHRKEHKDTPHQEAWANSFLGDAYRAEVKNLNKNIGGYPEDIKFVQSCIKESAERFDPEKNYEDISKYSTIKSLFDLVESSDDTINVLIWGSTTEPAILVKHCITTERLDILKKMRFIAHWTNSPLHQGSIENPQDVANCREDAQACAYLKGRAFLRLIDYYEVAAIGQHGIVSGAPVGEEYYDQFKVSKIGTIFVEGKFRFGNVDHSDAATYWTLLGNWGVSLDDVRPDGINTVEIESANEKKYQEWSKRIHDELLRRARAAADKL